jgi:hypothetical protein
MIKNKYANDVHKMMFHYLDSVIIKCFYNDSKITINILIRVQMDIMNYNI